METGYKTHVSCLAESVINSKKIVLFRRDKNYGAYYINIGNLAEIYRKLTIYSAITRTEAEGTEIPAHFECNNIEFDVIIYLDEGEVPVGFTEFHTIQGYLGKTINIYINHTIRNININIDIVNSLENLPERSFIGYEELDYTSMNLAKSEIKRIPKYSKYTNNLLSGNIYLGYGYLDKEHNLRKLPKLSIEDINEELDNTSIGYYNEKFTLYIWDNLNRYTIIPLEGDDGDISGSIEDYTEINSFGEEKQREVKILYGAGKYFVCRIESGVGNIRTILFDIEEGKFIDFKRGSSIVDPWDNKHKIISFEPIDDYKSIVKIIPELSSTSFDIEKFIKEHSFEYTSLRLERKYGNLFCFEYIDAYNNKSYIISNIYFCIVLSEDDYNNCVFINENTVLVDKGRNYELYNVRGKYTFRKSSEIYNTPLNNYRKSYLRNTNIPNIVGACSGLVFYEKDNNINYL